MMRKLLAIAGCVALGLAAHVAEAQQQQPQNLKFTAGQAANADGSVTPTLTWCTETGVSPGTTCTNTGPATACTATGDWTGTKAAAGTQTLTSVKTTKGYALSCAWPGQDSITLTWTPPTTNDDGSPLTDLAGYKIWYGTSSSMSSNTIKEVTNPGVTSAVIGPGLAPGTYYMVMAAYNAAKGESVKAPPTPLQKTIGAGVTVTQSVKVTIPNAPTGLTAQ